MEQTFRVQHISQKQVMHSLDTVLKKKFKP